MSAGGSRTPFGRVRSWLYVPAHRPELVAKALSGTADAVVLDLEDAVPAGAKDAARDAAVQACAGPRDRPLWVRVNAPGTPWSAADIAALAGSGADGIRLPKAADPDAVAALAERLALPLHLLVESARGLEEAFDLARAHPLVASVSLGEADLAADLRIGDPAHLGWARARVVVANRAAGLPSPVAGVWTDLADADGLAADSATARDAGFFGRSVIHPAQVGPVNHAFTPGPAEVARAHALLDSLRAAETAGSSAYLDERGRFVDPAVVAGARWVADLAAELGVDLGAATETSADIPEHEPARTPVRAGKENR
ncbi:MAG: CoA ester lyase [Pseudonocardia sp.]|nr:CoA ester lyase [Pseudonocardia sp.]